MKNSSLFRRTVPKPKIRPIQSELDILAKYREQLQRYDAIDREIEALDLGNTFYWYFRLTSLILVAEATFDRLLGSHLPPNTPRPTIVFCNRSTGGYYNSRTHTIGISLAMTVEFGEPEFMETLLHEIAHIRYRAHDVKFYGFLRTLGGTGRKAPTTKLLRSKRETFRLKHYPVLVGCSGCGMQRRYKTRRGLNYACARCCRKYSNGKFDSRFRLQEINEIEPANAPSTTEA